MSDIVEKLRSVYVFGVGHESLTDDAAAEIERLRELLNQADQENAGLESCIEDKDKRIEELENIIKCDNAVCLCGCPVEDHESYGEDGECCGVEGHVCIRTCPTIATLYGEAIKRNPITEADIDKAWRDRWSDERGNVHLWASHFHIVACSICGGSGKHGPYLCPACNRNGVSHGWVWKDVSDE